MKKSKFLKKSLAMLLALMLVVAMIPLSASAAAPVMRQVDVTAGGQVVQLVPGEGANTREGEISNLSQNITLTVLAGKDNVVYYTNKATSATSDTRATPHANGTWTIEIGAADVAEYEDDNGDIVINFSVADADKPATRIDHTVVLTPVDVETTTEIERFTINNVNNENVQLGETVIGAEDIYFTVPYDAAEIDDAEFRIRELEMASATATVTIENENLDYYYTTEANANKIVTDGVPNVSIHDGDIMTVENNGNVDTYEIHIDPAAGFTSFTTKEGLDAVMFTDTGDIAVLLPYGYSWGKDTISVTPVFDLDYDRATASWTSGTPITVATDDVITSNTFETFLEQETEWYNKDNDAADARSWEFRKNTDPLNKTFADFVRYNVAASNASPVEITYSEDASRTYNVYFFEPYKNQAAEITELTIGSETAVIDEANKTIDITLPMGTDVSDLNNGASYVEVAMVASNGASVDIPMQDVSFTETTDPRARYAEFDTTASEINATNSVQIRVVSEDRLTEEFYTLNVSVSDEFVKPALTDISIQSPDGVTIDGKITTDKNNINVVNFEVPYEVYDRGELNDWKLFYTKTIGSTISYEDADGDNVALPKSGAVIGTAPYVPDPNATELTATPIDLHVAGQELSAQATSYTIMITRATAEKISTLEKFDLYGVPDFTAADPDLKDTADVGTRFQYAGTVDQDKQTVEVKVPWSVYAQWDANEFFNVIAEATKNEDGESSNARIFLKSGNIDQQHGGGVYTAVINAGNDGETEVIKGGASDSNVDSYDADELWRLYDGAEVIVMSEELWVNLKEAGLFDTAGKDHPHAGYDYITFNEFYQFIQQNEENAGNYTTYTLNIEQDDPKTDNELKDLRLVDGTGWTAPLTIDTRSGAARIEGSIPYALTSDITDRKTWNPVYLEYNTSPYAFVLGVDRAGQTQVEVDDNGIPTAGEGRNGVFIDMADYLALYDNNYDLAVARYFTDGNPYFLIDRNGDVHIYNNDTETPVEMNMLAVSSEAPKSEKGKYQKYVIDLDVKAANNGTEVTSFYFKEYPTRNGVIDDTNKTITVTLPYGTEYTYLTPNYTVSEGAVVTIDDPELQGKPLFPGYTDVNFSTSRKMTVLAENESDSTEYTIRVQIEEQFSDVAPGAWYYDNVMDAAANGYVSGMGDGTFNPKGATTRAQFASMIAKAMGYDDSLAGETRFKDVPADQWYAGAITYCFDNDIISGYDDGTFQPDKTITRQEAASILKNAFNLTGNSGEKFPDDSAIAGWAKENVYAVKHSGLMKGDADTGNFRPTSTIIRAEAASILMNANRAGLIK